MSSKRVIGAVAVLESGRDCSTPLEPLGRFCPPACLEVNIVGGRHTDVDPRFAPDHVLHAIGFVVAPVAGAVLALGVTPDTGVVPVVALIMGAVAAEGETP